MATSYIDRVCAIRLLACSDVKNFDIYSKIWRKFTIFASDYHTKIMAAQQNKRKGESTTNDQTPSYGEVSRWLIGLVLMLSGLYSTLVVASYYFSWSNDYDIVMSENRADIERLSEQVANFGGVDGAWLAQQLIGSSFGVFGIVIPLLVTIIGVRILLRKPMKLNHSMMVTALLLLFGSLTLGEFFGSDMGIFNSGLGGAYGIELAKMIGSRIGSMGVYFVLILGWIVTGIFINRNFIFTVNRASSAAIGKGGEIVSNIKMPKPSIKIPKPSKRGESQRAEQESVLEQGEESEESEAGEESEQVAQSDDTEAGEVPWLDQLDESSTDEQGHELEAVSGDDGVVVTVEVNELETVSEDEMEQELYDPMRDLHNYQAPPASLLVDYQSASGVTDEEIYENKSKIEETLKHFGIAIQKIKATVGPTITLYEIVQAQGVKIAKIQGLENDIAQSLKAFGIRIIAPIPGLGTIGIEVPNRNKQVVSMYSSVRSLKFQEMKAELPVVIGSTIQNESYVFDLAKMPHLLVAGATGQGKSVGLNAIITSLLYRKHPSQLKFVMIDPKMVEFSPYRNLERHFMAKMESEEDVIITDPKKAVYTLNALCEEMEKRLKLLSNASVRNIIEYNDKFVKRRLNPENGHFYMPYIVVIVDEFADLIMMSRDVEAPVMRLAQKARAVGIHLIVATQRPDVKVITGGIKANFPARVAFRVMQMIDSRTIIDQPGANQLIGRGDMLFSKDGELTRIQCALVETEEVEKIVQHIGQQQGYNAAYMLPDYTPDGGSGAGDSDMDSGAAVKYDAYFAEIARTAVSCGYISTSAIQRNFEVGFNRAGRIMTQLEKAGIVSRQEGSKPRDILFHDMPSLEAKLQSLGLF